MYCIRKIPAPFQNQPKTNLTPPPEMPVSAPIAAQEKPAERKTAKPTALSPLAALLFLDIFSNKKGDE